MDLSFKTQISDDDDDKSDASIVTNTTVNTLNGRSPILFPTLQKYTTEKEEDPLVFTGTVCSPVIPVLSALFLTKSLKQASQSSFEENSEDSNDSYVSESLISIQPQKTKQEGNQNHPARLFHMEHKEQTRGVIQEENEQNITREVIQNKKNELRSKDSVGENNPVIPDSVTDSQETYLPDIESEIECTKKGEMKEKTKERRKQDKLFDKCISESNTQIMSYEMVAVTNSFLNNEKLNMLDGNNGTNKKTLDVEDLPFESCMSAKDSDHSSKRLSAEKNANLFENDVQDLSEQMTCLAAPIQANCESISSPQKLLYIAASKSENLPQLSEKDISCICIGNTIPNIIKEKNKISELQEVTQLCVDDTREITQLPMYGTREITQLPIDDTGEITQDHQVHVQNERCRTIFSSQNEMETTVSSSEDQLFERVIQNEGGVLKSSKEVIPSTEECLTQPIETISPKQSAANNCKNNKKYLDTFDGSQNLFPDTQSSVDSITKSTGLSSVNLQNIDMKCSDLETATSLLNNKSNRNQTPTIQLSTDSKCLSTVAGQHQILDVEMTQQTQSDSQENPVLSCSQELNAVSGHYNDQEHHRNQGNVADVSEVQSSATQYDGIVTLEDAAYQFKLKSSVNNVNDDMDISSDVEPSQMILMPSQHDAQAKISDEKTRSDCLTSSQSLSSSSLSSLGDISEGGVNYKNKEKHILYKVEKMQRKIQKKLLAASKKSSVLDVDITKQKLQAVKGILIKIAERHKVERNKLSLEVKRSSKSRACKTQIRENLIELSERQKLLYKLFQNHKEISRIIRDDLNKSLASALKLDDEGANGKKVRLKRSKNDKTGGMKIKKLNGKKSEKGNNEGFMNKTLKSRSSPSVCKEEYTSNTKVVTVTKKVPNISYSMSKVVASNLMEVVADDRRHGEDVIVTSSTNGINLTLQRKTVEQENDNNYCISLNGTQELYCDKEEEMTTDNRTVISQRKTQIECSTINPGGEITTVGQSSSLMTQTPGFLGTKCNAKSDEHMLKAMGLFTSTQTVPRPLKSKGHGCGLKQDDNDNFITLQQKMKINEGITPQFSEGNCMPISSISASKVHQSSKFDPKISTEESRQSIIDLTGQSDICVSAKDSVSVQKGHVLQSSAPIVLPRPSISASKSLTSASIVLLRPSTSASKSLVQNSVPVLIQKTDGTCISVPISRSSVMVGNSEQIGYNVTEKERSTKFAHLQGNKIGNAKVVVPTGICMPNNNITDCQTNGKLTSSQEKQKRQTCSQPKNKLVHGSQKTSSSRNKTTPDDENCMHSQNEVMKKVMEDAMRIINDTTIGSLKRPLAGIENGWQAKQSRLYTSDPVMPMNRDIFKSPPFHQVEAARDISPSAASFATFRSTFPEHSPNLCTQSQYLTEDPSPVGICYGLKYPPLDMLIEKQILRPGENILSVKARDKEFKASLTTDGFIESIGGELFQTPVKWLAAILGKPVPDVKKHRAYREVHYRGKPLIAYVEDPTLVPEEDEATPDMKARHHNSNNGKADRSRQDSMQKLKNMLNNCTIRLLDDKDLVSDNDLPENFWTEDFSKVKLSIDMWKEVDKWD